MRITSLRLRNYRGFENLFLADMPRFAVFVGANGSGKSTFFDVFSFIQDSLRSNVRAAIDRRGGVGEVRTRDRDGQIEIELTVDLADSDETQPSLYTYGLKIGVDDDRPAIKDEYLRVGPDSQQLNLFDFQTIGKDDAKEDKSDAALEQEVKDHEWGRGRLLLGSPVALARTFRRTRTQDDFRYYLAASNLNEFLSNAHLSDIQVSTARQSAAAGHHEHLSVHGDNLPLVAQYMHDDHPNEFQQAVDQLGTRVPDITNVEVEPTIDRRVAVQFRNEGFEDPFSSWSVSDGTIKMWAYLLLLYDPSPHPLLCIEEPENQLYHQLMGELVEELQSYADRGQGQVFVSTHSPDVVNAAEPSQVYWFTKTNGVSTAYRASEFERIVEQHKSGDQLGRMWRSGAFPGAHPRW